MINTQKLNTNLILSGVLVTALAVGFISALAASAAPPYAVTYNGTAVTQAVPGKAFTVNYTVTNTGSTEYSGVKVIFHVPSGVSHTAVSPPGATIDENTITWNNVPIAAGKTFKPSLTMVMDAGTAIGTKKNVWVEVTGDGMEANSQNFSLTAVSKITTSTTSTASSSVVTQINAIHRLVFGRNPSASEHAYWLGRVTSGAKTSVLALLGAMQFHNANGISH